MSAPILPVDDKAESWRLLHHQFLAPDALSTKDTPARALIVGQCIFATWSSVLAETFPYVTTETELFNNAWNLQTRDCSELDFQVVSVPLRAVMPEPTYMQLDYSDEAGFERLFDECCQRLGFYLDTMMAYNRNNGLLSFVANFFVPVANPLGRLLPRYDLRNIVYFIERLNERLVSLVSQYRVAHVLDINQIASVVGKRFVQDDSVSAIAHNAIMMDHASNWDAQRIEAPAGTIQELFQVQEREFIITAWHEVMAMFRTIRGVESVKMVVMDLDDTLWRGIAGETNGVDQLEQAEGWPLGVAEALTFLKKRGILLAIASKNDENFVRQVWPYAGRLELEDFSFIRINWKPKAENVAEMIKIANISPDSVVFVDDNPVERRAVAVANPGIRTLGMSPYLTRSTLLWSSETQVPLITEESARRTLMMQAQERREADRSVMSRAEFLDSQDIRVAIGFVGEQSPRFPRAFELLNKTNQFNTTGKRWTATELHDAMQNGLGIHCFTVSDRFSDYGLVGAILTEGSHVKQFVMSCRVLGMDIEIGALAVLNNTMVLQGNGEIRMTADLVETPANFPCRDLFDRAGYVREGDHWEKTVSTPTPIPEHLRLDDLK